MGLVGHFSETELSIDLLSNFKSHVCSFSMSRVLHVCRKAPEKPNFMKILKILKFLFFEALEHHLRRISSGALRCRAMSTAVASGLRFLTLLAAAFWLIRSFFVLFFHSLIVFSPSFFVSVNVLSLLFESF